MEQVSKLITDTYHSIHNRHLNYLRFITSISLYQQYVLILTVLIYVNTQISRYAINYLYAQPSDNPFHSISMSTNISSFGYGIVIGFGFTVSFVFFGAWVARMIHYYSPKKLLLFGVLTSTVATVMLSSATTFGKLMGSRIILGLGQAFCAPASYTLLVHFFPQDDYVPILHSVFGYGVYLGGSISSLLLFYVDDIGWKESLKPLWVSGFCLTGILFLTVKATPKPTRARLKKEIRPALFTLEDSYNEIRRNNAIITLFSAGCIRFMAEYTLASFLPLFFVNKFPAYKTHFCIMNAIVILVIGAISSIFGSAGPSVLALDKPGSVTGSCSLLLLLAVSSTLAIPAALLTFLSPNFYVSMAGLVIFYLLTEWWFRPVLFVFQRELRPEARNIALGYLTMCSTLCGSGAASVVGYFIGRRDDALHGNVHVPPKDVSVTLSWTISIILFLSVLLFLVIFSPSLLFLCLPPLSLTVIYFSIDCIYYDRAR
jgi:MFS family permease